jgi:periplasmic protein CpxP/Spy
MRRSTKALLAAAVLGVVSGTGIAFALPAFGMHDGAGGSRAMGFYGRGYGGVDARIERLADRLDLSQTQRDALRAIVDKARPQMRALRDRLFANRRQLQLLAREAKPDETRIAQLADAQGRAIAELIVLRTKMDGAIRGVLTDEQRDRLERWRRPRREHDQSSSWRGGNTGDYSAARLHGPNAGTSPVIAV